MGLADPVTTWVFLAVTVVLFVATVAFTPRLTRGLLGVVARSILVLLTGIAMVLTVGVKLNADNGWYVSWSDLAGNNAAGVVEQQGADPAAAAGGGGGQSADAGPASLERPPLPQPGQRIQNFQVKGAKSGLDLPVQIVLPESYEHSPQRRYPVIVAYHGYPGTPTGWTKTMGIKDRMDEAVAAKAIAESIVVVPQINDPLGRDGECVDGPAGTPQLETWLMDDVPEFSRTHLRAAQDRSGWAAMGYSAGAYCAAVASVLHPDVFGAGIVLSGYFAPDWSSSGAPILPPGSAQAKRYDLTAAITAKTPAVAMWIQAGQQSPYWPQTQAFLTAVKAPMSVTTQIQPDTGHRWDVWKAQVPQALAWLGAKIPGFHP